MTVIVWISIFSVVLFAVKSINEKELSNVELVIVNVLNNKEGKTVEELIYTKV